MTAIHVLLAGKPRDARLHAQRQGWRMTAHPIMPDGTRVTVAYHRDQLLDVAAMGRPVVLHRALGPLGPGLLAEALRLRDHGAAAFA